MDWKGIHSKKEKQGERKPPSSTHIQKEEIFLPYFNQYEFRLCVNQRSHPQEAFLNQFLSVLPCYSRLRKEFKKQLTKGPEAKHFEIPFRPSNLHWLIAQSMKKQK